MYLITQVTQDPLQLQTLILPDGSSAQVQLYFRPMQYGWFLQKLTWNNFVANEIRITVSPNILRPFCNQLTFGLACYANINPIREPTQQEDFSSGNFSLYILSAAEVTELNQLIAGNANV